MCFSDLSFYVPVEAIKLQKRFNGNIETSVITIAELLKGCEERGVNGEKIMSSIFKIAAIPDITLQEAIAAANYINEKKLKTLDALHCALAGGEIISFDKDFDKTGIKRTHK